MAVITKRNLYNQEKEKCTVVTGVWFRSPVIHYLSNALLHEAYLFFASNLNNFQGDPKGGIYFNLEK